MCNLEQEMILTIKNCNNIAVATISVEENKLNIKYAMNGAGKSTIARAIELHAKSDGSLLELTPFKFLNSKQEDQKPELSGLKNGSTVLIFNDAYINQFVFKEDEILANSFQIFFQTPEYEKHITKIEQLIAGIKDTFRESKEIDQVIGDLTTLSESFGKSKSGYSEAGALAKGLGKGNKVANIPKGLESFTAYLKSSANSKWLKWHMEGNDYSVLPDNCPYCTSETTDRKDVISQISKEFDPKSIEHLNKIMLVVESLRKYFSKDANEKLASLTHSVKGFSREEIGYLVQIKGQADTLRTKLLDLKGMSYFSLKDNEKVSSAIAELKINLSLLSELNSQTTSDLVTTINKSLDDVLAEVGVLQGEIAQQNQLLRAMIEENKLEINNFLRFAGYKYVVDVEDANQTYKMRLRHVDSAESVTKGSQHLSYGEKNAFSLVLFMYECISKKPDIIILDDPISSFDKNKKYAVIDMLFRGDESLRNRTVLMMTHDLEPVIDVIFNFPRLFAEFSNATFLDTKEGNIKEIPIARSDIMTFGEICKANINDCDEDAIKLVYLRRYYEILNSKEGPYQVLSSLLHKVPKPYKSENGNQTPLTDQEVQAAVINIKEYMPRFEYDELLAKVSDENYMTAAFKETDCNYEKLHIFRILRGSFSGSAAINNFINKTFHIENEFIMQINPRKYDIVPTFIIDECSKILFPKAAGA